MEEEKDSQKKKKELLNAIDGVKQEAEEYTSSGRKIVEDGQFVSDVAEATEAIVKEIPEDSIPEVDKQVKGWKRVQAQIHDANRTLTHYGNTGQVFISTATSASSFAVGGGFGTTFPHSENYIYRVEQLSKVFEKADWVYRAQAELSRLGLNVAPSGQRSALSLLQEAHQEFLRPAVGGVAPVAVLIAVRGPINRAISDLLRWRPIQEKAKNITDQIISIGTRCGKSNIQRRALDNLAIDVRNILDQLSSAKDKSMNRDAVRVLFHAACTSLTAFLGVIDESKLQR